MSKKDEQKKQSNRRTQKEEMCDNSPRPAWETEQMRAQKIIGKARDDYFRRTGRMPDESD